MCGSVWLCPVCSAKIRQARADEIEAALGLHFAQGGKAFMLTLTVPHYAHDRLEDLMALVSVGFRGVTGGRAWMQDRCDYGVRGHIRATEVTVGRNGWHPHLHVLVLVGGIGTGPRPRLWDSTWRLAESMGRRWQHAVEQNCGRRPDDAHGWRWSPVTEASMGEYLAKVQDEHAVARAASQELTRSDLKSGRYSSMTPFELLGQVVESGDTAPLGRWWEYEQATRNAVAIRWSNGLRGDLGVTEVTDEELAEAEQGGEVVCVIPGRTWTDVTRVHGLAITLLRAAELAGRSGVAQALRDHGLRDVVDHRPEVPPP